jgi:CRISPR-associated protein Cas7/Cst2/DevR subtype I-B
LRVGRIAQIAILCNIPFGLANADWTQGQRIMMKKFTDPWGRGIIPFISPRAVKYAIRQALRERGYEIDPFQLRDVQGNMRSLDMGDPKTYIDNDLFGFMAAEEKGKQARRRQGPVAIGYLSSVKPIPDISTDLGLRSPRSPDQPPMITETEVATFPAKLRAAVYDYVGVWEGTEGEVKKGEKFIDDKERRRRMHDLLDILLTPSYVLPRRSSSLAVPEYIAALVSLSSDGIRPIYQYLSLDDRGEVDSHNLSKLKNTSIGWGEIFMIEYDRPLPNTFPAVSSREAVERIRNFLLGE